MTTLVGVPFHDVERAWPLVETWIAKACKRGGGLWGVEDIKALLINRDMQLWLAITGQNDVIGVCVTEIRTFPRKKVCFVVFCTGRDSNAWAYHLESIIEWAKAQGCQSFKALCRWGWLKVLKGKLDATHVLLERELK